MVAGAGLCTFAVAAHGMQPAEAEAASHAPKSNGGAHSFDADYDIYPEELGSGAFGTVYRGTHKKSGRVVAVKKIRRRGASSDDAVRREVEMHQVLLPDFASRS